MFARQDDTEPKFIPSSLKLFVLFIVYAIRRTGQSGFPSSSFPTHRLIKDITIACKPHYYYTLLLYVVVHDTFE